MNIAYDREIISSEDFGITEESVVWIDNPVTASHDYVVTEIAKSKNVFCVYLKKVEVR